MKISTLIDTNILIDVWGDPTATTKWSADALIRCHSQGRLLVNTVIWSEVAPSMTSETTLETYVSELEIDREHVSWHAAFEAGMTHARYRRAGGLRERTLPDFIIGAHALVAGHRLLTRDRARYATYFP